MAEKEIKITFAGEKLEALSFFLAEQGGKTVEELLKSHLDKSYEKNVPAQVRKFVESRMETLQETANQEQESQRTGGTRQQRASGRRSRETQNQEEQPREPVLETVEETAEIDEKEVSSNHISSNYSNEHDDRMWVTEDRRLYNRYFTVRTHN